VIHGVLLQGAYCCQVIPRLLLISIWEHYFAKPFNARKLIALGVFQMIHKQEHNGREIVVVEAKTICTRAWMKIYMISKAQ